MNASEGSRLRAVLSLGSFLMATWVGISDAAQIEVIDGDRAGEKFVSINGVLTEGDFDKVKRATRIASQSGTNSLAFLLNSNGGDIAEAMKIGRFARELMAATYVSGNSLYIPGTPAARRLESQNYLPRTLRPIAKGDSPEQNIVRCYSACVLVFFGGVRRGVTDNLDFRDGIPNMRTIPVIGIHRPYYEADKYGSLSPTDAKRVYDQLEQSVRRFLMEMGATQLLIDRMFRKASNDVELISGKEFNDYYQYEEPFFAEWLIARCNAFGSNAAPDDIERLEYSQYERALKEAIDKGLIDSQTQYDQFVPPGISLSRINALQKKMSLHYTDVHYCREKSVKLHQINWLGNR